MIAAHLEYSLGENRIATSPCCLGTTYVSLISFTKHVNLPKLLDPNRKGTRGESMGAKLGEVERLTTVVEQVMVLFR